MASLLSLQLDNCLDETVPQFFIVTLMAIHHQVRGQVSRYIHFLGGNILFLLYISNKP